MKKIDEFLLWFFTIAAFIATLIFGYLFRSEPYSSIMKNYYSDSIGTGMVCVLFPAMLFTFNKWLIRLIHHYCKKIRNKSDLKYKKE